MSFCDSDLERPASVSSEEAERAKSLFEAGVKKFQELETFGAKDFDSKELDRAASAFINGVDELLAQYRQSVEAVGVGL